MENNLLLLHRAIRAGDCLGMLVEFFYANQQMDEAYKYLREVLSRIHTYILIIKYFTFNGNAYIQKYFRTYTHS